MLNKSQDLNAARRMHACPVKASVLHSGYVSQLGKRGLLGAASLERGSLYIYDFIGQDVFGEGLSAKSVVEAIDAMQGVKALDIFINSPGGFIDDAKAIGEAIRRFKGEKVAHIDGLAASAASFIPMFADKIISAPQATWMIHDVWGVVVGNATDALKAASLLDLESNTFAQIYAKRTGQNVEDVRAWMKAETWMNAATAKARGFTDEIAEPPKASAEGADALVSALERAVNSLTNLRTTSGT